MEGVRHVVLRTGEVYTCGAYFFDRVLYELLLAAEVSFRVHVYDLLPD